jgi:S1-C subfamily serine protease
VIALTACTPFLAPDARVSSTQEGATGSGEVAQASIVPALLQSTPSTENEGVATQAVANEAESLQQTLIDLYQAANPAVVYILVGSGSGSGFVYSQEGYIVTNHHVVSAGSSYEVVFSNGDRQRATLVGADADSDLAVLQVEELPPDVEPLSLADAEDIQVGQLVVAIGNPFGEQGSMSLGIVSGLDRSLRSQRSTTAGSSYTLPRVIQTDAPINPGNSGGPLLNLEGEVIGVNAAIASTTGANTGVGFSIPVAAVRQIVPVLIQEGEYVYPYMGTSFDDEISLSDQSLYGVSQTQGAYVVGVTPGGPAAQAGLVAADPQTGRGGDLIVEMDGHAIGDFSDLNGYLVFHTRVGQTIEITVLRDGQRLTVPLKLGARP